MKITIITSAYNSEKTIEEAIKSVVTQTYNDIEYIVIDAASSDNTLEIINHYKNQIDIIVSEPDQGIYDGLNKGIALAKGDVIGFLHSDDLYKNNKVIEKVAYAFEKSRADSVYGDLVYVSEKDTLKIFRYWKSGQFHPRKLKQGWMPPHPTFFVRRKIYEQYGLFDTSFKIAADYDSILRFLGKHQITTHYLPEVLIKMRVGGESNKSLKNLIQKSREDLRAMKSNNIGHLGSLIFKNISKIPQFLSNCPKQ